MFNLNNFTLLKGASSMATVLIVFTFLFFLLNVISILIMIFLERKDPRSIQSWILIFLLLPPGFSIYIYIVFGRGPKLNRKKIRNRNYRLFNELSNILNIKDYNKIPNEDNLDTSILKFNLLKNKSAVTENNRVKILNTAQEKFEELIKDIKNAKHNIHFLYYIIKNDNIGNLIINLLAEKAMEGVKVRVIYDDTGCICIPKKLFDKLKNAGGEVYPFFPSYAKFININLNYRNHRKIVVIDGKIGYVGGINIGDEYMSLSKKLSPWKDCHLKIIGDAVNFLQLQFIKDLSYVSNHKIETEKDFQNKYFPKSEIQNKTYTQIVSSGPDEKEYEQIKSTYLKMIYSAKKEIFIQTPYLALDDGFLSAILYAAQYGIKIKIMLPYIYDKRIVYRVTCSYIQQFMDAGIEIYLYKGFLHSKVMIMDDCVTSIGTANFNIRSFSLNYEINAFMTDKDICSKMKKIFFEDIKNSIKLDENYEKSKSLLLKFEEGICRLFTPLL